MEIQTVKRLECGLNQKMGFDFADATKEGNKDIYLL